MKFPFNMTWLGRDKELCVGMKKYVKQKSIVHICNSVEAYWPTYSLACSTKCSWQQVFWSYEVQSNTLTVQEMWCECQPRYKVGSQKMINWMWNFAFWKPQNTTDVNGRKSDTAGFIVYIKRISIWSPFISFSYLVKISFITIISENSEYLNWKRKN